MKANKRGKQLKAIRTREVEHYNAEFDRLCMDSSVGKAEIKEPDTQATNRLNTKTQITEHGDFQEGRKYTDWIKTPISRKIIIDGKEVDYYKMAFDENADNDIFRLCRRQLPRNWFVSRSGEVLEYNDNSHEWEWRKDSRFYKLKRKSIEDRTIYPELLGNRIYEKSYDIPKTKNIPVKETIPGININSYILTGIVFGARVFGVVAKDRIKKQGIKAFTVKDKQRINGHHIKGYRQDKEFNYSYEENMMYNNCPDGILFITSEMHDLMKSLIRGIQDNSDIKPFISALEKLLKDENPNNYYAVVLYPKDESGNDITINDLDNFDIYLTKKKNCNKIHISAAKIPYVDILEMNHKEFKDFMKNDMYVNEAYRTVYILDTIRQNSIYHKFVFTDTLTDCNYTVQYIAGDTLTYIDFLINHTQFNYYEQLDFDNTGRLISINGNNKCWIEVHKL